MALSDLKKPKRPTLSDQAYEVILAAIIDGVIPAGAPLGLQDLADRMSMSMIPIREAIRQLEASGIVEILPHKGARVRELSRADMEDTYAARITIEGILVHRAALTFDAKAEVLARESLENQRHALERGDAQAARAAHAAFHYTLYRAAGSRWLLHSVDSLWRNSERYRAPSMGGTAADIARREHEAILQACVAHHPEIAEARLREHLLRTVSTIDSDLAAKLGLSVRPATLSA